MLWSLTVEVVGSYALCFYFISVLSFMCVPVFIILSCELCNMPVDGYFSVTSINQITKVK